MISADYVIYTRCSCDEDDNPLYLWLSLSNFYHLSVLQLQAPEPSAGLKLDFFLSMTCNLISSRNALAINTKSMWR
ncbi:MAG: hypothetical protein KGZ96_04085, partial [Clostridia bacterium]|nr:hypothetical protein [Clostridia bacterium]